MLDGSSVIRVIDLDEILHERISTLRSKRDHAKATLERARAQYATASAIDTVKIDAFARLMTEKLDTGADRNAFSPPLFAAMPERQHGFR